jgi:hypothetical protein
MTTETPEQAARRFASNAIAEGFALEALYQWPDGTDAQYYWRIRLKHPDGRKKIWPLRWDGAAYILSEPNFPGLKPLYGQPGESPHPVFVVEGERCVDVLVKGGVCAVTSGAATSAGAADWSILKDRTVRVWADNDPEGQAYARAVTERLSSIGCSVSLIDIEKLGLGPKGDAVDWTEAHPEADYFDIEGLARSVACERPTTNWARLLPSELEQQRANVPTFPIEVFPPEARSWIEAAAEGAGAPVDYAAMTLLGAIAAVTGVGVEVKATAGWSEPLILWQALVGGPSAGKSPALAAGRALLDALEEQARQSDEQRRREHATKREAAEAAAETWRSDVREAAKAKTQPPEMPADAEQILPFISRQIMIGDTTIESIPDVLRGNPRGVILWRDELTAWLTNMERYNGGSDRAYWLEAWNAARVTINRKHKDALVVPRFAVSIIGSIQPDRIAEIFSGPDDGMSSRFLYAWPRVPEYIPLAKRRGGFDQVMVGRLQRIADIAGDTKQPMILALDDHALLAFDDFCSEHHRFAMTLEGVLAGSWGKGKGNVLRLAAALRLLDWSETSVVEAAITITTDALQRAVQLWQSYFWPHAQAVLISSASSPHHGNRRRVIRYLQSCKANDVSREEIRRNALGETVNASAADVLMEDLERDGYVRRLATESGRKGGRPPIRWEVNPALRG